MDVRDPRFPILQSASRILNNQRPDKRDIELVTNYADAHIPDKASLPVDELAVIVALRLMGIDGDPTKMAG